MSLRINHLTGFGGRRGDPFFQDVYLLVPCNGANNGTSFPDVSRFARTIGVGGNAKTSTAVSKFNGSSGLFDGVNDFLGVADTDFGFLTSYAEDFTAEVWVYQTNRASIGSLIQMGSAAVNNPEFTLNLRATDGIPYFTAGSLTAKSDTTVASGIAPALNTWAHIAATFTASSGAMATWCDGALVGTGTKPSGTFGFPAGTDLCMGAYTDGTSFEWVGNLSYYRITRGRNRYPAPFNPLPIPFPHH